MPNSTKTDVEVLKSKMEDITKKVDEIAEGQKSLETKMYTNQVPAIVGSSSNEDLRGGCGNTHKYDVLNNPTVI